MVAGSSFIAHIQKKMDLLFRSLTAAQPDLGALFDRLAKTPSINLLGSRHDRTPTISNTFPAGGRYVLGDRKRQAVVRSLVDSLPSARLIRPDREVEAGGILSVAVNRAVQCPVS